MGWILLIVHGNRWLMTSVPTDTGILRVTLHQARNLDTNGPDEAHRNRSAARFLYEAAQKVVGGVTGILLSGPFTPYVIVRTEDGKVAWKSVRRRRTMNPLFEVGFERGGPPPT